MIFGFFMSRADFPRLGMPGPGLLRSSELLPTDYFIAPDQCYSYNFLQNPPSIDQNDRSSYNEDW